MDNLEKYIKDNAERLENTLPCEGHRERMIMRLSNKEKQNKRRLRYIYTSSAAAIVIVIFTISAFIHNQDVAEFAEENEIERVINDDILYENIDEMTEIEIAELEYVIDRRLEEAKARLLDVLSHKPKEVRDRIIADLSDDQMITIDDPRTKNYLATRLETYKKTELVINRLITQLR